MKEKILVCLQHTLTEEQVESLKQMYGEIVLLKDVEPGLFAKMADSPSGAEELTALAVEFCRFLRNGEYERAVMPLGSPALMWEISRVRTFPEWGGHPEILFAHSRRESVDTVQPDGSIRKTSVFKFEKWIELE